MFDTKKPKAAGIFLPLQFLPAMRRRCMYLHKVGGRALLILLLFGNISEYSLRNPSLPSSESLETDNCSCAHDGKTLLRRNHHNPSLGCYRCGTHNLLRLQILDFNLESPHRPASSLDSTDMVLRLHCSFSFFL